jgi:hypothetical protein
MKKVIFSTLILSAGLFACNKAEVQTASISNVATEDTEKANIGRTYFDDGTKPGVIGATYGCTGAGGACAQGRSVATGDIAMISDIITKDSHIASFNQFNTRLNTYFTKAIVEGVMNGQIALEVRGEFTDASEAYFVFTLNEETISVVPLKK